MKLHTLKLMRSYAMAKLQGIKPFEIRLNDRDFKVGDLVNYTCPDDAAYDDMLRHKIYQIKYITDYAQKDGYVVFTDRLLGDNYGNLY